MNKTARTKQTRSERSVLDMTAKTARAFLLKPESYCRLDLPPYFDFRPVLRRVEKFLAARPLNSLKPKPEPCSCEGVNYTIYSNKDGRYAWEDVPILVEIQE